jgi:hypothetical protein
LAAVGGRGPTTGIRPGPAASPAPGNPPRGSLLDLSA